MKVFVFVVALIIFLGSLYLLSLAFAVPGFEALLFAAGLLGVALAFAIPAHILKRVQP